MNDRNNIKYKVMLVDDSSLVRGYLQKLLQIDPQIEVCATAENGQIAVENVKESNPDIILLDIEMPVMNGITAIPLLLNAKPDVKIIMVSTLTSNNAAKSIEAMSKGATDYIEKPSANTDKEQFKNILIEKIKAIARPNIVREVKKIDSDDEFNFLKPEGRLKVPEPLINAKAESKGGDNSLTIIDTASNDDSQEKKVEEAIEKNISEKKIEGFVPQVLAIGSSTGGPQVLQEVFGNIKTSINHIPIFITQHMPPQFTTFLAKSIGQASGMLCIEPEDGQVVDSGCIYVAPGDYHMIVKLQDGKKIINLTKDAPENFCRPAVDPMLRSLVEVYGKNILTVILTGMGQDGMLGAKAVHDEGGKVIIQDEESSVVWGMPGAVAKEGFQDAIYSKDEMAQKIINLCKRGL